MFRRNGIVFVFNDTSLYNAGDRHERIIRLLTPEEETSSKKLVSQLGWLILYLAS